MKKMLCAVLLASGSISFAANAMNEPKDPHIVTNGFAEIKVAPDMATLSIAVNVLNLKSLMAKQAVDMKVADLFADLKKLSVDRKDIDAGSISTYPEYRYPKDKPRELIGYRAQRSITIRLYQLDKLSQVMDTALKLGLNQISQVRYGVKDEAKYRKEALQRAIQDSRQRAKELVKGYGIKLGKVYAIEYQNRRSSAPMPRFAMNLMASDAKSNTYVQNEISFSDSINVVFLLKN